MNPKYYDRLMPSDEVLYVEVNPGTVTFNEIKIGEKFKVFYAPSFYARLYYDWDKVYVKTTSKCAYTLRSSGAETQREFIEFWSSDKVIKVEEASE